jgi:hypothetical protein
MEREAIIPPFIAFVTADGKKFPVDSAIVPHQFLSACSMSEAKEDGMVIINLPTIESSLFAFAIDLMRHQWHFHVVEYDEYTIEKKLYDILQKDRYSTLRMQNLETWFYILKSLDYLNIDRGIISAMCHCFVVEFIEKQRHIIQTEETFGALSLIKLLVQKWIYLEFQPNNDIESERILKEEAEELFASAESPGISIRELLDYRSDTDEAFVTELAEEKIKIDLHLEHINDFTDFNSFLREFDIAPQNIVAINMSQCDFQTLPHNIFHGMTNLKYLSMTSGAIQHLPEDIFKDLGNLKFLHIYHFEHDNLEHLLRPCSNLVGVMDQESIEKNTLLYNQLKTIYPALDDLLTSDPESNVVFDSDVLDHIFDEDFLENN